MGWNHGYERGEGGGGGINLFTHKPFDCTLKHILQLITIHLSEWMKCLCTAVQGEAPQ